MERETSCESLEPIGVIFAPALSIPSQSRTSSSGSLQGSGIDDFHGVGFKSPSLKVFARETNVSPWIERLESGVDVAGMVEHDDSNVRRFPDCTKDADPVASAEIDRRRGG